MKRQPKPFIIETKGNSALATVVQQFLFSQGYRWYNNHQEPRHTGEFCFCSVYAGRDQATDLLLYGSPSSKLEKHPNTQVFDAATELGKFVDYITSAPEEFGSIRSQNETYDVVIGKTETQVGCQTFQNEAILRLAEAIRRLI